jgi:PQQ-like domain
MCTASDPSDPVTATDFLIQPDIRAPICDGARFVSIDNTVLNANVVLFRRNATAPTPRSIGYSGAVLGTLKMGLGKGVTLNAGDILYAVQYMGDTGPVSAKSNEVTVGCDGGANVVTQHNDNFRTGAYLAETTLTPKAVRDRKMSQKFRVTVDGSVITQPLYVRNVEFPGGRANGLFVGTLNNKVYALDADNHGVTKKEKKLVDSDPSQRPIAQGIQNTPVIDVSSDRIYVLFKTGKGPEKDDDFQNQDADSAFWLVARRLHNLAEVARVRVGASVWAGDGSLVTFSAKNQTGHPALLLDRGSLYLGFGSRADMEGDPKYLPHYHGWIFQYRAADLALEATFCTTPNRPVRPNLLNHQVDAPGAGVWQGGGGLAADPDGNIYLLTGNGRTEWDNSLYGDSFLKLTASNGSLVPSAYAPPMPEPDQLEAGDADLGSGGPLVLPGFNYVLGGGKTGYMYLLDRTSMQLQQRLTVATNQYDIPPHPETRWNHWDSGPHLHGSPTFWPGHGFLYVWGEKDFLKVYAFDTTTKKFSGAPILTGAIKAQPHTMPGGMMSLSANGDQRRSGIIWAILSIDDVKPGDRPSRAQLFAFDAETLGPLWDHQFGSVPHWGPPTIADGKVFVTTSDAEVIAYELGPDPNNLNWTPYKPKLAFASCQACHTDQQREELTRRNPLRKFFIEEAAARIEPARAKQAVSPPEGSRKNLVLEGNGVQIYTATASKKEKNKLEWTLKETAADLVEVDPEGSAKQDSMRVRLSAGPVWTASDGSRIGCCRDLCWKLMARSPVG